AGQRVPAALEQVAARLLGGQAAAAVAAVEVRVAQVGGTGAQCPVGEQVPAGADRAQLPGAVGAEELPPVAVHLRQPVAGQRQRAGEVLLGGDLRAAALVHRRDAAGGGQPQRRPLQLG